IINEQTTIGQFPVNLNVANLIFLDNGVLDEATPVCADGILANGVEITGIDELKIENEKMKIYPNPAKEYVHIQSEFPIQKIEIYNPMGKLVRIEPDITERIDVSSLSEGLYLVRIYGSDWVNTQKIIVVR
ncbi:MAG: T9SS type A sorting domain-containing protein, partial [Candidatus Symbiothrix sp.]|nr:T9SS type A sorting domain-containing protein [Candidatus Symbiothrix sp.]